MNVDDLTPQQLRELANQKEREELSRVVKEARIKEDLYEVYSLGHIDLIELFSASDGRTLVTKQEIDKAINKLKKSIMKECFAIEKGAICKKYADGKWATDCENIMDWEDGEVEGLIESND